MQIGLACMAWASGASKQLMNILHHSCLTMSYSSTSAIISALADSSIEKAKCATAHPHALTYDNINISTSIFVEQGPNMMSKVQSGTFAVIYELHNAQPEDMQIQPMIENLRKSSPLELTDCRPSTSSLHAYATQSAVNVAKILLKYVEDFIYLKNDILLQHTPRRPIPKGHKTIFHPLRATTIDESTVEGNLHVHDDVYLVQLDKNPADLNNIAIPSFNDQLTNARIRGGQILRRKDSTHFDRRDIFQLAFGGFHLAMNLIWGILEIHRGTINQTGSLTHFFAVLEKTRLGGEHPDYHTLLAALTQILHGLILNAWRIECGYPSLDDFAKANPSAKDILSLAQKIMVKYTVPELCLSATNPKVPLQDLNMDGNSTVNLEISHPDDDGDDIDIASESVEEVPVSSLPTDVAHDNITLLTRDLLYVIELVDAMSTGDFGRIEDILPTLTCMFRGAGSNNYSTEILHFLFSIKEVWTPGFA